MPTARSLIWIVRHGRRNDRDSCGRPTPLILVAPDTDGHPGYTFYAHESAAQDVAAADVPSRLPSSVNAIALGVLIVGLAGPVFAGWSADRWGTGAPLLVQAACAALAALASMALRETALRFLPRRGARCPIATEAAN